MHPKDKGQLHKYATLAYKLLGDYTPRNLSLTCSLAQAKPRVYRLRCRGFQTLRKHDMTLFFDIGPSSVLDVWADMDNRTLNIDFYSKFEPLRKIWIRTLLHSIPTSALTPPELLLPPAYTRGVAPPGSGTGVLMPDVRMQLASGADDHVDAASRHRDKRLRGEPSLFANESRQVQVQPVVEAEYETGYQAKATDDDDDDSLGIDTKVTKPASILIKDGGSVKDDEKQNGHTRQYNHSFGSRLSNVTAMTTTQPPPFVPWSMAQRDTAAETTTTRATTTTTSLGLKHKPKIIPRLRSIASVAIGTSMDTEQLHGRKRKL